MRDISEITTDLNERASRVKSNTEAMNQAKSNYDKATVTLSDSQKELAETEKELTEALNLLVPGSFQGRVRTN